MNRIRTNECRLRRAVAGQVVRDDHERVRPFAHAAPVPLDLPLTGPTRRAPDDFFLVCCQYDPRALREPEPHAHEVAVPVAVGREHARQDRLHVQLGRRRVEPHLVRDVDRPPRVGQVHADAVDALGRAAAVPHELDRARREPLVLCNRADRPVVGVDHGHGQPVGIAQAEPDPSLVRRAVADRRERRRQLRGDDRRRDELQPLGDRERRRGTAEQAQNEKGRQEARQPAREAIRRPSRAWGEHALARPRRARAAGPPRA